MNPARLGISIAAMPLVLLLAGCAHSSKRVGDPAADNRHLVASIVDEQAALAIQRQRIIYPFHFVTGTARLNELGQRDLTVLADHYRLHPGVLRVWQDHEAPGIRAARLKTIRDCLGAQGVPVARMTFNEAWPGGDGEGAEAAALLRVKPEEPETKTYGMGGLGAASPPPGQK